MTTLGVPAAIFVAFVIAHLAVPSSLQRDPALLPSRCAVRIASRSSPAWRPTWPSAGMWLFVGVAYGAGAGVRNLDRWRLQDTLMIVGFLLLSPLVPGLGQEFTAAHLAAYRQLLLPTRRDRQDRDRAVPGGLLAQNHQMLSVFTWRGPVQLPDIRTLLPLLLMWGIALVIVVFEKDLGSALVFFFVFLVMLYVAAESVLLVIGLGLAISGISAFMAFGHAGARTPGSTFADAQNTGYQLTQAIYSIADGDLFGVGIGRGLAEQIPVVESDFIFAAIAEEIGLLGAAGVLLLFLCFAVRGFVTAARAKSDVSSFVAVGLTSMIVLQAFII
ncbi:MAG: FtsW/RodA/SpoVE family cell cycle protein [Eggerthellaceae bacterium]